MPASLADSRVPRLGSAGAPSARRQRRRRSSSSIGGMDLGSEDRGEDGDEEGGARRIDRDVGGGLRGGGAAAEGADFLPHRAPLAGAERREGAADERELLGER